MRQPRFRLARRRAPLAPLALAALLTAPLAPTPATARTPAAGAASPTTVVPVQRKSSPTTLLSTRTYRLTAGDKVALDTDPLRFETGSWGAGRPTNVGTTLLLTCVGPDGRRALHAHDGENLTPQEPRRKPDIRALLEAPRSGTYRCELRASAYTNAWARGMTVHLIGEPGFASALAGRTAFTWDRPAAAGDLALVPGRVAEPMNVTRPAAAGGERMTVTVDAEVTTCNNTRDYAVCAGRDPSASGAVFRSWLVVQGRDAAGRPVGRTHRSAVVTRTVTAAKHHHMLHHTLPAAVPSAARRLDVRLRTQVVSGDRMVFHAGYGYTHGVVLR